MWKNKHAGASAKIKGKAKVVNGEAERKDKLKGKGDGRRKEGRLERDALEGMEDEPGGRDDGDEDEIEDEEAERALHEG